MAGVDEYLQIYIQAMFVVTGIACAVELFSYGIFKALSLVNIMR